MTSTPKKKKPPDLPPVVPTIRARLCFPLCSNCADTYGFNLPCSALGVLELGGYSTTVSFQWLFRSLRTRSSPLNPESVVGCGGLASFGCRRSSFPATVPFVRFKGSRSVVIENFAQGWQIRYLASFTGSASLVLNEKLGLLFVMHQPSFLRYRIRVWVRFTTSEFVCYSAGVQTRPSSVHSLEFPYGNWVEAVCRFSSVIIPGTGVDIQRGGIGLGLALCALQVFEQAIGHSTNGQKTLLRHPAKLLKPAVA